MSCVTPLLRNCVVNNIMILLGEILDLCWSLSDNYLASCSVDNTIIVWNGLNLPSKLHTIMQHSGMVKGICWDPIGKYLASQSDDRTLRVWRTEDWSMETKILEPFTHCSGTTHLLRLSWSPDGRNIVTAHSLNNTFPVSHVVDRNNWNSDKSFVGHKKAIEVTAFNPNLFSYNLNSSNTHTVVALGSKDSSISIWSTAKTKPILIVERLFSSSILDLSWGIDGYQLLACSWDSSIAFIKFSQAELGYVLESSILLKLHMDIYGCTALPSTLENRSTDVVIEFPNVLAIQHSTSTVTSSFGNAHYHKPIISTLNEEQIEVRTKEGKRRITPLFLSPPLLANYVPISNISGSIQKDIPISNVLSDINPSFLDVDDTQTHQDVPPVSLATGTQGTNAKGSIDRKQELEICLDTSKSFNYQPFISRPNLFPNQLNVENKVPDSMPICFDLESESKSTLTPSSYTHSTEQYTLYIDNSRPFGALLKVNPVESNSISFSNWEAIITSQVVCYSCSRSYLAISCTDFSLHVFTSFGRKLVAPLQLPSQVAKIFLRNDYLLLITFQVQLYMWVLPKFLCKISAQPISPLLANKHTVIINLSIFETGPILTTSNDTSFLFNMKLNCWQCILLKNSLNQKDFSHPFSSLRISGSKSIARNQLYLESQLNSSLALHSRSDFLRWLFRYVQFLSENALENQLRQLLVELVQPILNTNELSQLSPMQEFISHDDAFLFNLLGIIAKNAQLQNIYSEFSEFIRTPTDDTII